MSDLALVALPTKQRAEEIRKRVLLRPRAYMSELPAAVAVLRA